MNRINKTFDDKKDSILSIYFTAGFPTLYSTIEIIKTLSDSNVDIIEIGIPFSDPVADGIVIQNSNTKALENGMSLSLLFTQLADVRQNTSIPLVLMSYFNPILQFGVEHFLIKAKACGIDGVIIPDLPPAEYAAHYKFLFDQYEINIIFLITPLTPGERVKQIDELSNGFIYMVTTAAVTGSNKDFATAQYDYFKYIRLLELRNPVISGFGIHDKASFETACAYTDGAIIGSAFIKAIAQPQQSIQTSVQKFIQTIRS